VRSSLAALLRSDQLGLSCRERTGRRGTLQPVRTFEMGAASVKSSRVRREVYQLPT
jgi:hypothetical protein